jgi:hypothetical protein
VNLHGLFPPLFLFLTIKTITIKEEEMQSTFSTKEILSKYPSLKSSTLDYLVRDKIVSVLQKGKGIERKYTEVSVVEIEIWLSKREGGDSND